MTLNVEWIWLSMLSELDSQCWVNLTLNVESTWLSMLNQLDYQSWVNLTLNVELIRLSMLSQFDSQCWVNLTLNVESIWLKYSPVSHFAGSNFSSVSDSTFYVKMTFFFSLCIISCRHNSSELDDATPQSINQDFSFSIYIYIILEYFL